MTMQDLSSCAESCVIAQFLLFTIVLVVKVSVVKVNVHVTCSNAVILNLENLKSIIFLPIGPLKRSSFCQWLPRYDVTEGHFHVT